MLFNSSIRLDIQAHANIPAMACPYFLPLEQTGLSAKPLPARMPLGTLYDGVCKASTVADQFPSSDTLRDYCNFGYGRGRCPSFPEHATADAVRFTIHRDRLICVLEKDGAPVWHGDPQEGLLQAQAAVFRHHHPPSHD
jgi:hypothetical protein